MDAMRDIDRASAFSDSALQTETTAHDGKSNTYASRPEISGLKGEKSAGKPVGNRLSKVSSIRLFPENDEWILEVATVKNWLAARLNPHLKNSTHASLTRTQAEELYRALEDMLWQPEQSNVGELYSLEASPSELLAVTPQILPYEMPEPLKQVAKDTWQAGVPQIHAYQLPEEASNPQTTPYQPEFIRLWALVSPIPGGISSGTDNSADTEAIQTETHHAGSSISMIPEQVAVTPIPDLDESSSMIRRANKASNNLINHIVDLYFSNHEPV